MATLNWQFLTEAYKKAKVEDYFLLKTFGKVKQYSPLLQVKVRMESGAMTVASLGKVGDPPKAVRASSTVTETTLSPAQIFEYDTITEEDVFTATNPALVSVTGIEDVISNKEYIRGLKLEELKRRVERRKELMFAQILSSGQISYNDGERSYSVSFSVTSEDYTLSSSSKVYTDLLDIADEMRQAGHNPDIILVTPEVEAALLNNTQIEKAVNKQTFALAQVKMETYTNARDVLVLQGLPKIVVYLGSYTDSSGSATNYITGNKIILADSTAFRLAFGAVHNYHISENPVMGEVFSWEEIINNGTEKAIFVLTRPLPYLISSDAVRILNVTIS